MDAKITKQRLGNLLAYDWLKILVAVAAAAAVLSLFFTMVRTRPTEGQKFEVYAYTDVAVGEDFSTVSDELLAKKAFSYDILSVSQEKFTDSNDYLSGSVYTARRMAGEGTVLFITDLDEYDEEGNLSKYSLLKTMSAGTLTTANGRGGFYEVRYFMECSRDYLAGFFGEELTGDLNETAAEESFLSRNSADKRFRSSENRKKGIAQEKERLELLRSDYFTVQAALKSGVLSYREVEYVAEGESVFYSPAFDLSGLGKIAKLVYYTVDGQPATEKLSLMLYHNDYGKADALNFEALSFLRYLIETYA